MVDTHFFDIKTPYVPGWFVLAHQPQVKLTRLPPSDMGTPPPSEPGAITLKWDLQDPSQLDFDPLPPSPNLNIASLVGPLTRSPMGELYPGGIVPCTSILFPAHLLTIRERQKSGSGISNMWFRITEYLDGDTKNICIFMTTSLDPWY